MKWTLFLLGALIAVPAFAILCPECEKEKKKSTVTSTGPCIAMALGCPQGHWDENGKWVEPDSKGKNCNSYSCRYMCSNGHGFELRSTGP